MGEMMCLYRVVWKGLSGEVTLELIERESLRFTTLFILPFIS
jgi:hypothetical protein